MQIYRGLPSSALPAETALTMGVFDGVHIGHQALVARALERARSANHLCGVMTFDPHPVEVLAPDAGIKYLTSLPERLRLFEATGVDFCCIYPFTVQTSRTLARDFMRPLVDTLRLRNLVIGHDFTLGYKRQGNAEFLLALGAEWGFSVDIIQPVVADGSIVSSTRIRNLLAGGDVESAARLLGRPAGLSGVLSNDLVLAIGPGRLIPASGLYSGQIRGLTDDGVSVSCQLKVEQGRVSVLPLPVVQSLIQSEVYVEFIRPMPNQMTSVEEIEHTADVALRVRGSTLADLLEHAAEGMFALMADPQAGGPGSPHEISVSATDVESLLVNWLNEWLSQADVSKCVFRGFHVGNSSGLEVRGSAEAFYPNEIRKHIKAVTFNDLQVEQRDGWLETTIVFDV